MKPTPQAVQKQIYQARDDILDETGKFASTARSQLTGVETIPMARQAPPALPEIEGDNTEAYKQKVEEETRIRMGQLKAIIEEEAAKARAMREEKERLWEKAQKEGLTDEKGVTQERQPNLVSLAVKKIKGRLGQVGKGKMEKGRGGTG